MSSPFHLTKALSLNEDRVKFIMEKVVNRSAQVLSVLRLQKSGLNSSCTNHPSPWRSRLPMIVDMDVLRRRGEGYALGSEVFLHFLDDTEIDIPVIGAFNP